MSVPHLKLSIILRGKTQYYYPFVNYFLRE